MTRVLSSNWKYSVYVLLITLTLLLHVFNNLQISESLKYFHIGAFMSLAFGILFLWGNIGRIGKLAYAFVVTSFLSSSLSHYDQSLSVWLKLFVIIGATSFIVLIPIKKLVIGINMVIPIALFFLVKEYFAGTYYRYQGFYEDPNYMCTTLLVLFFYLQLLWELYAKKNVRAFVLFEMLVTLFLVTTSISRTGLICYTIMAIGFFWDNFLRNKILTIVSIVFVGFAVSFLAPTLVDRAMENYTIRETENNDTFGHASDLRREISMRGVNFVLDNPIYWLQGMGEGSTAHASSIPGFHVRTHHGDHNTITCCFSEQGIVGLSLMLFLFYNVYRGLRRRRELNFQKIRIISIIVFFVFIVFSMSINQMVYLPFWLMIFTLSNIAQNEDSAYSLLR